ncbi:hypothetical protein PLESTB_000881200 [Pleodorina starrii]|uniref:Uncharacterized protein n=1 Tax=Pleodorina starrii TaxID=330485 RepID=A0A9W6BMP2_9CHLO|nr:hypothetical protein PLESTB_000881200 [Pleodorina starrii]
MIPTKQSHLWQTAARIQSEVMPSSAERGKATSSATERRLQGPCHEPQKKDRTRSGRAPEAVASRKAKIASGAAAIAAAITAGHDAEPPQTGAASAGCSSAGGIGAPRVAPLTFTRVPAAPSQSQTQSKEPPQPSSPPQSQLTPLWEPQDSPQPLSQPRRRSLSPPWLYQQSQPSLYQQQQQQFLYSQYAWPQAATAGAAEAAPDVLAADPAAAASRAAAAIAGCHAYAAAAPTGTAAAAAMPPPPQGSCATRPGQSRKRRSSDGDGHSTDAGGRAGGDIDDGGGGTICSNGGGGGRGGVVASVSAGSRVAAAVARLRVAGAGTGSPEDAAAAVAAAAARGPAGGVQVAAAAVFGNHQSAAAAASASQVATTATTEALAAGAALGDSTRRITAAAPAAAAAAAAAESNDPMDITPVRPQRPPQLSSAPSAHTRAAEAEALVGQPTAAPQPVLLHSRTQLTQQVGQQVEGQQVGQHMRSGRLPRGCGGGLGAAGCHESGAAAGGGGGGGAGGDESGAAGGGGGGGAPWEWAPMLPAVTPPPQARQVRHLHPCRHPGGEPGCQGQEPPPQAGQGEEEGEREGEVMVVCETPLPAADMAEDMAITPPPPPPSFQRQPSLECLLAGANADGVADLGGAPVAMAITPPPPMMWRHAREDVDVGWNGPLRAPAAAVKEEEEEDLLLAATRGSPVEGAVKEEDLAALPGSAHGVEGHRHPEEEEEEREEEADWCPVRRGSGSGSGDGMADANPEWALDRAAGGGLDSGDQDPDLDSDLELDLTQDERAERVGCWARRANRPAAAPPPPPQMTAVAAVAMAAPARGTEPAAGGLHSVGVAQEGPGVSVAGGVALSGAVSTNDGAVGAGTAYGTGGAAAAAAGDVDDEDMWIYTQQDAPLAASGPGYGDMYDEDEEPYDEGHGEDGSDERGVDGDLHHYHHHHQQQQQQWEVAEGGGDSSERGRGAAAVARMEGPLQHHSTAVQPAVHAVLPLGAPGAGAGVGVGAPLAGRSVSPLQHEALQPQHPAPPPAQHQHQLHHQQQQQQQQQQGFQQPLQQPQQLPPPVLGEECSPGFWDGCPDVYEVGWRLVMLVGV